MLREGSFNNLQLFFYNLLLYQVFHPVNLPELAPGLKKFIAILIILLLAGHTCGYFVALADSVSYVLGTEERVETGIEEKKEKECNHTSCPALAEMVYRQRFNIYADHPGLLHIKDLITPPPDQAFVA